MQNRRLWERYRHRRREIAEEAIASAHQESALASGGAASAGSPGGTLSAISSNGGAAAANGQQDLAAAHERMLFHGSPFINAIVQKGFDERHAYLGEKSEGLHILTFADLWQSSPYFATPDLFCNFCFTLAISILIHF